MAVHHIRVAVDINMEPAKASTRNLKRNMKDKRHILKNVMEEYMMQDVITRRFASGGIPRWHARDVAVPWPMLIKSGRLMNSVTNPYSGESTLRYLGDTVILDSKVPYSMFHNKPRGRSEPGRQWGRPFLYFTQVNIAEINKRFVEWSLKQCAKSGMRVKGKL
jgi:phage gpG-like protein